MRNEWIEPLIVVGPAATGDYYFNRDEIVNLIWDELEKGCAILIAAPRRVGKTSVMKYMEKNPRINYKIIFENIQGIKSEEDFYKLIYSLILNCLSKSKKFKSWFEIYIKSKAITEFDIKGVIKTKNVVIDYIAEINHIIPQLDKDGENIVLLIDELPEVLHNLEKNGKIDEAKSILKNLRRWRQDGKFIKLKFVLAGSIGIHYVVDKIEGRNSDLNDLAKVSCNPLEESKASEYIDWATKNANVKYNDELKEYLLCKTKYFVPYFINLMLNEVSKIAKKANNSIITNQTIDEAFSAILKNNEYFIDWKNRLKNYMPQDDFKFVNDILKHIAHKEQISIQEIYDKAIKFNKEDEYMSFIRDLTQDGYILENDGKYLFISPFLKEFWKLDNPIYNG